MLVIIIIVILFGHICQNDNYKIFFYIYFIFFKPKITSTNHGLNLFNVS